MGCMGLIFTPVLVRRLLRPSSLVRTYLGLKDAPNSPIGMYNSPPASHPLICETRDITVVNVVKKVAQNPTVLASYYR